MLKIERLPKEDTARDQSTNQAGRETQQEQAPEETLAVGVGHDRWQDPGTVFEVYLAQHPLKKTKRQLRYILVGSRCLQLLP